MESAGLGSGLAVFALAVVGGLIAVSGLTGDPRAKAFQSQIFLYALGVRFAASLVIYQFGLVNTIQDEDGSGWVVGMAWKNGWVAEGRTVADLPAMVEDAFSNRNRGYYYMLAGFFWLTGLEGRLAAAALNCFFGALTVVLAYRTARLFVPARSAEWVGWSACVFPSLIIWSAQTVKEPVVILLESAALYACLRLRDSALNPKYLLMCLGAVVFLMPFRFYASYVAGVAILVGLGVRRGGSGRVPGIFTAGLLAAVVVAMFGGFLEKEQSASYMDLQYVENFRKFAAAGQGSGSAAYVEADLQTSSGLGLALAFGGVHLLFAPFPWQWTSLRAIMVAPETMIWWWLCWQYVGPGAWYAVRRQLGDFAPLLLFVALMALLYSVMFSNVGLAYRQRAQLLPWLFILGAVGRELRLRRSLGPVTRTPVAVGVPRLHSAPRSG